MSSASGDVVIVGGGIVGMVTAYYLAKAGVASVVVERDAIGSHASGYAYGGLSPVSGFGIPGPLAEVAQDGMRLHRELAESVVDETGIGIDFRVRPSLGLALTEADVKRLRAALPWQQQQPGYSVRWLDSSEARRVEPRISSETLGAVLMDGTADVEPYKLVLALTRASEAMGVTVRHGRVTGLRSAGSQVSAVLLERGEITCSTVVLALGPWSGETSAWLRVPIDVRPLKGQILRLRAPGPPVPCSVGWGHNYATTKPDGLLWAGTTEEEAGFDEETTPAARDEIGAALVRMLPAMADAQLVYQTACLRPLASDGLLLLGRVPGFDQVYMATGAGRKGILLGPSMGRAIADLIVTGSTKIALDAFAPGRFAR
ncbi:MAG TPA: FAD-dependent oxidoreductase [Candidatus Methylomirabilis sp.]|nr:FAD-dependent oxidoreductase [Candidatus Methylomirabilis sp.]